MSGCSGLSLSDGCAPELLWDYSLIAPGMHCLALGTIWAAQGAKSGAESGRKWKEKVLRLPQK